MSSLEGLADRIVGSLFVPVALGDEVVGANISAAEVPVVIAEGAVRTVDLVEVGGNVVVIANLKR